MRKKSKQKRVSHHNGVLSLTRGAALAAYDPEADAAYFSVRKGKVARTVKLQDWLLADIDTRGALLGIEMLFVSRHLPRSQVRQFATPTTIRSRAVV